MTTSLAMPARSMASPSFVRPIGPRLAVGHGGGGTGSGMDNGFKQFTDGSYVVVALANMEPPAGGSRGPTRLTPSAPRL